MGASVLINGTRYKSVRFAIRGFGSQRVHRYYIWGLSGLKCWVLSWCFDDEVRNKQRVVKQQWG